MKLNHIIYTMFACVMLATSCSQNEEMSNTIVSAKQIKINVSDAGMTASTDSRATTDATYKTEFETGDEIGLIAVNNGAIIEGYGNLKLTKTATGWDGLPASASFAEGTKFYAYYPYSKSNTFTYSDDIFSSMVNSWNPATASSYDKGDLMTTNATDMTISADGFTTTVNLVLNHKMSMIEITNNSGSSVKYNFTNTDMTGQSYTVTSNSSELGDITLGSAKLTNTDVVDGKTRVLVNPSSTDAISVKVGQDTYKSDALSLLSGNYYSIAVGSSTESTSKDWELAVGDYMLKDGNLLKSTDKDFDTKKSDIIGVVYYVGNAAPTILYASSYGASAKIDCSDSDGLAVNGWIHGLVMAVDGIDMDKNSWGNDMPSNGFSSLYQQNNGVLAECSVTNIARMRILGYDNTATIKKLNATESCYAGLVSKLNDTAAPASTSGWFVPSNGDINEMITNNSALTTAFGSNLNKTLWIEGSVYMSSSAVFNSKKGFSNKFYGVTVKDGTGTYETYDLGETAHVLRFALAF